MNNPEYYKVFNKSEVQFVQDFCFKKLNVNSTFQLNDKFEGKQFYNNSLKKYMISKFLLTEVFEIKGSDLKEENVINWDFNSYFSGQNIKLNITEEIFTIGKQLKLYDVIIFLNLEGLRIQLYSNKKLELNHITPNLLNV